MTSNNHFNPSLQAFKLLILGSIAITTLLLLYWPGLFGPFLLDDQSSIEAARLETFSWLKLLEISTQNESGPLGRPLSIFSFALNHLFFGSQPFSYKLTNVILHFSTSCVLAWFTYLLLRFYRPRFRYKLAISAIIAFIWLVHPLQVSTVLYVVQRMTILSGLFTLLACAYYVLARLRQMVGRRSVWLYILSGLCWLLGLASKETAILLPFYLFITEFFILQFRLRHAPQTIIFKQWARISILLGIFCALLAFWFNQSYFQAVFTEKPFTMLERLFTQVNALVFYIRLIYLPVISKMSLYHDDFQIVHSPDAQFIAGSILIIGLIGMSLWLRHRAPWVAFGLAWFFVSHLLESTILPLELVFEHRNYLASAGLILIPVLVIAAIMQSRIAKIHRMYMLCGILLIAMLMSLTFSRAVRWSSIEHFLQAALLDKPNSARTHIEFANWLLSKGAYLQAYGELLQAQEIQPENTGIDIHILLVHCYAEFVPEEIYTNLNRKLRTNPITPYVILGLDQVVQNLFNPQCAVIERKKVHQLIKTAYENPFLKHHPRYLAVLYHLEAGIMILDDKPDNAKLLLMQSFEAYPKRMQPLVAKAAFEINSNDLTNAKDSLEILDRHRAKRYAPKEQIDLLRKLYLDKTTQGEMVNE